MIPCPPVQVRERTSSLAFSSPVRSCLLLASPPTLPKDKPAHSSLQESVNSRGEVGGSPHRAPLSPSTLSLQVSQVLTVFQPSSKPTSGCPDTLFLCLLFL